jgi:hypothetical protein
VVAGKKKQRAERAAAYDPRRALARLALLEQQAILDGDTIERNQIAGPASPGERCPRIVKRRGKLEALVAVARSILVITWNLLASPAARYQDLGAGYHASHLDTGKKVRNHVRGLEALGYAVVLTQTA